MKIGSEGKGKDKKRETAIAYDITALDFVEWNGDKEYAKWKLRNALMSGLVNQNLIDSLSATPTPEERNKS